MSDKKIGNSKVNPAGFDLPGLLSNPASIEKMSKNQIIGKIKEGLSILHGRFFHTKSSQELDNEIAKQLLELPREDLVKKLKELQIAFVDGSALKLKNLVGDLEDLRKKYEEKLSLFLKEDKKTLENTKKLNEFSKKYFKKDFDKISKEIFGIDPILAMGGKLSILKKAMEVYHIKTTPQNKGEIEGAENKAKDIDKSIVLLGKYRVDLNDLEDKIYKLEDRIGKEIVSLAESRDYRKNLPAETIEALRKVKAQDPLKDIRDIHDSGFTGKGVTVVVIDSGIHPHPDFKGRIKVFKDFIGGKHGTSNAYDDNGHGTHVAGILAGSGEVSGGRFKGIAPDADIIVLRVIDRDGNVNEHALEEALKWIADNKERYNIKVVNTSIYNTSDVKWGLMKDKVDSILDKGIVWVGIAGNQGRGSSDMTYPGKEKRIISVGSLDELFTLTKNDDIVSTFSSWNKPGRVNSKPNFVAPGSNIVAPLALNSKIAVDDKDKSIDINSDGKEDYVYESGTSMASPYIAGIVALLLQANPDLTSNDIRYILMDTADPIEGIPNFIQGSGVVNPQKALKRALYLKKNKK